MNTKIVISAVMGIIIGAGSVMAFQSSKTPMPLAVDNAKTGKTMQQDPMMSALEGKTGDEFDREFIAQMTIHHKSAIQMAELALNNAKRSEIKQLAEEIIKAQSTEISQMQMWHQEWFGSPVPASANSAQPGSPVHSGQ